MGSITVEEHSIKGTDSNGVLFNVAYKDIDRLVDGKYGCKIYMHDGYMIHLHQSHEYVTNAMREVHDKVVEANS